MLKLREAESGYSDALSRYDADEPKEDVQGWCSRVCSHLDWGPGPRSMPDGLRLPTAGSAGPHLQV